MKETPLTVMASNSLNKIAPTGSHCLRRAEKQQQAFTTTFLVSLAESLKFFHPLLLLDDW